MDKEKTSSEPHEHKAGDDPERGSSPSFDTQKARELYDMGMRDVELMKQLGAPRGEVIEWRKQNGLSANRIVIWNEARARELYDAGATDKQIAEELSKAGGDVSASSVATWRRKNKLDTNVRGKWSPEDETAKSKAPEKKENAPAPKGTPEPQVPDVQGGTRHGHLVALPSAPKSEEPDIPPGLPKRGFHQRKRNRADMPLPTTFARPMPTMGFFDEFEGMDAPASGSVPEQEAIYMFATILHLCRLDYGWDSQDVEEFVEAVAFTEQILYNTSAQTGTMEPDDYPFGFESDYDDDFDYELEFAPAPKKKQPQNQQKNKKKTGDTKNSGGGPKNSGRAGSKKNKNTKK